MQTSSDRRQTRGHDCRGRMFLVPGSRFDELRGVESVESGYTGAGSISPRTNRSGGGSTGRAEVVQITFDPSVVTFRELLQVFFAIHDRTMLNR